MGLAASPAGIAVFVAAAGWPLAAALGVVVWSRARAARQAARGADLDARLKGLYRTVELRAAPPGLASAIDALAAEEGLATAIAAQPAQAAPSPAPPQG